MPSVPTFVLAAPAALAALAAAWGIIYVVARYRVLRDERARFRSFIEHSSDIIFLLGPHGTVEYVSPSLTRVLGWAPATLIGTDPFGYIHPEDRTPLREAMLRAFESDPTLPGVVPFRARDQSGEWVRLEANARAMPERTGPTQLLVAARDVRERHRLETELVAARRLESIGSLAGGVAHDFNNLLTAILGNVSLLRPHLAPGSEGRAHLDEIGHSARRGAESISRLLAFARRQMIEPRAIDLAEQVQGIERLLRRLLRADIRLEIATPPDTWLVRADPTAIEQAIVNLVVNARDAMPDGGRLSIAVANQTFGEAGHEALGIPAGDWVRVDVTDTGTGIEEHLLGHLFEPFFTTKSAQGGSGLGLATVYGSVSQAGGHVRVRSAPGQGATFSLFLPRLSEPTAPVGSEPRSTDARASEVVLLVEDDPAARGRTAGMLGALGYTTLAAPDGEAAVSLAAAHAGTLHAIVSDLVMPHVGGVETVARIRRTRPRVGVVYLSGHSEQALGWQGTTPEGGLLLKTPFDQGALGEAVRRAIADATSATPHARSGPA